MLSWRPVLAIVIEGKAGASTKSGFRNGLSVSSSSRLFAHARRRLFRMRW